MSDRRESRSRDTSKELKLGLQEDVGAGMRTRF